MPSLGPYRKLCTSRGYQDGTYVRLGEMTDYVESLEFPAELLG